MLSKTTLTDNGVSKNALTFRVSLFYLVLVVDCHPSQKGLNLKKLRVAQHKFIANPAGKKAISSLKSNFLKNCAKSEIKHYIFAINDFIAYLILEKKLFSHWNKLGNEIIN